MASLSLREGVIAPVAEWASVHGYKKRYGRYSRLIDADGEWEAAISFGAMRRYGTFSISCHLGLDYTPASKWIAAYLDDKHYSPVFVENVLRLEPGSTADSYVYISSEAHAELHGKKLVHTLDTYLDQWLYEHASIDRLLERQGGWGVRRAVTAALAGRRGDVATILTEWVDEISRHSIGLDDEVIAQIDTIAREFSIEFELPATHATDESTGDTSEIVIPIVTSPESIQTSLFHYGEDELAQAARHLSSEQLQAIWETAGRISFDPNFSGYFAKAVALAAVQVLEGKARPLHRTRRRPLDQLPPWLPPGHGC